MPRRDVLRSGSIAVLLALAAVVCQPQRAAAASCESLMSLTLPNTMITFAGTIAAGTFRVPSPVGAPPNQAAPAPFADLPAFCRVAATLKPSSDSDIKIEVWLPSADWNGKFMAVGNGGFSGAISYGPMRTVMGRGYAVASTDTGHQGSGGDASWASGHPEKQIDFGYRAVHEMTLRAKTIVAAFYSAAPRYSYWNGCSSGGKQGLKEAQRFPDDYDGIIAGAPANNWTHLLAQILWVAQAARAEPADVIPQAKYGLIHNAVLAQCDALDGVKDGILEDPRRCQFNPEVLQCKAADAESCLTVSQVAALKRAYATARNPRTGEEIYPGLSVGSELGWARLPQPFGIAETHYKHIVFQDPAWDFRTFNLDSDLAKADAIDLAGGQFRAVDPDLTAFKKRGGKLLQYHGWNDQQISAQNSINYYESVVHRLGSARDTDDFYRLFMVPGVRHCAGGDEGATDRFDAIAALEQWVEHGVAPGRIVASHMTSGVVDRTRPLCPYPQAATYVGRGSTDEAANFLCKVP
jgi:tannase/feruloyl esterase